MNTTVQVKPEQGPVSRLQACSIHAGFLGCSFLIVESDVGSVPPTRLTSERKNDPKNVIGSIEYRGRPRSLQDRRMSGSVRPAPIFGETTRPSGGDAGLSSGEEFQNQVGTGGRLPCDIEGRAAAEKRMRDERRLQIEAIVRF